MTNQDLIDHLKRGLPITKHVAKELISAMERARETQQSYAHMLALYQEQERRMCGKIMFTREEVAWIEDALRGENVQVGHNAGGEATGAALCDRSPRP